MTAESSDYTNYPMSTLLKASNWFPHGGISIRIGGGAYEPVLPPNDYTEIKHHHDFDELVVIAEGHGIHCFNGKEYPVVAGDVFVIKRGDSHYFHHRDNMIHLNVMYDMTPLPLANPYLTHTPGFKALFTLEPILRQKNNVVTSLRLTSRQLETVRHLWRTMKHEEEQQLPGFEVILVSQFQDLAVFLSRIFMGLSSSRGRRLMSIENTITFMEEHYAQTITLQDLYNRANMSRPAFMRHFKDSTGISPINYLNNIRIEHAARLLRESTNTITDIAFEAGFHDSNYFSRAFKKVMKKTPREFRRNS